MGRTWETTGYKGRQRERISDDGRPQGTCLSLVGRFARSLRSRASLRTPGLSHRLPWSPVVSRSLTLSPVVSQSLPLSPVVRRFLPSSPFVSCGRSAVAWHCIALYFITSGPELLLGDSRRKGLAMTTSAPSVLHCVALYDITSVHGMSLHIALHCIVSHRIASHCIASCLTGNFPC